MSSSYLATGTSPSMSRGSTGSTRSHTEPSTRLPSSAAGENVENVEPSFANGTRVPTATRSALRLPAPHAAMHAATSPEMPLEDDVKKLELADEVVVPHRRHRERVGRERRGHAVWAAAEGTTPSALASRFSCAKRVRVASSVPAGRGVVRRVARRRSSSHGLAGRRLVLVRVSRVTAQNRHGDVAPGEHTRARHRCCHGKSPLSAAATASGAQRRAPTPRCANTSACGGREQRASAHPHAMHGTRPARGARGHNLPPSCARPSSMRTTLECATRTRQASVWHGQPRVRRGGLWAPRARARSTILVCDPTVGQDPPLGGE